MSTQISSKSYNNLPFKSSPIKTGSRAIIHNSLATLYFFEFNTETGWFLNFLRKKKKINEKKKVDDLCRRFIDDWPNPGGFFKN